MRHRTRVEEVREFQRIAFVRYLNGTDQPETLSLEKNVFGMNEGPKAEVDKVIGCMRVKGFLSTMQPGGISSGVDKFFEWVGATDKKGRTDVHQGCALDSHLLARP